MVIVRIKKDLSLREMVNEVLKHMLNKQSADQFKATLRCVDFTIKNTKKNKHAIQSYKNDIMYYAGTHMRIYWE